MKGQSQVFPKEDQQKAFIKHLKEEHRPKPASRKIDAQGNSGGSAPLPANQGEGDAGPSSAGRNINVPGNLCGGGPLAAHQAQGDAGPSNKVGEATPDGLGPGGDEGRDGSGAENGTVDGRRGASHAQAEGAAGDGVASGSGGHFVVNDFYWDRTLETACMLETAIPGPEDLPTEGQPVTPTQTGQRKIPVTLLVSSNGRTHKQTAAGLKQKLFHWFQGLMQMDTDIDEIADEENGDFWFTLELFAKKDLSKIRKLLEAVLKPYGNGWEAVAREIKLNDGRVDKIDYGDQPRASCPPREIFPSCNVRVCKSTYFMLFPFPIRRLFGRRRVHHFRRLEEDGARKTEIETPDDES